MRKQQDTGAPIMRVIFGFFTHSEMVTQVEAQIGSSDSVDCQDKIASVQLMRMNRQGKMGERAHFFVALHEDHFPENADEVGDGTGVCGQAEVVHDPHHVCAQLAGDQPLMCCLLIGRE